VSLAVDLALAGFRAVFALREAADLRAAAVFFFDLAMIRKAPAVVRREKRRA
jgi:hypothetical protein